jgi:hypothetical protein
MMRPKLGPSRTTAAVFHHALKLGVNLAIHWPAADVLSFPEVVDVSQSRRVETRIRGACADRDAYGRVHLNAAFRLSGRSRKGELIGVPGPPHAGPLPCFEVAANCLLSFA